MRVVVNLQPFRPLSVIAMAELETAVGTRPDEYLAKGKNLFCRQLRLWMTLLAHARCPGQLNKAVRNQPGSPLQELTVLFAKCVELFTLGIEHADNMAMAVHHRNNHFGASSMKGG